MDILFLVVLIVVMFGMMFWQSKKAKQQQAERQDFRSSLQPGTEVITIGGIIGKVVSVDTEYEEIVVDSEGSQLRFGFNAISREYVRPAYIIIDLPAPVSPVKTLKPGKSSIPSFSISAIFSKYKL